MREQPGRAAIGICALVLAILVAASCSSDDFSGTEPSSALDSSSLDETTSSAAPPESTPISSTIPEASTSDPSPPTTSPPTTTLPSTTTTIAPTTTTTTPLVTEGALVLVANATGMSAVAAFLSGQLQAVGYSMKEPTNAAGYEDSLDSSKIYFLPAAEAAAQSLAIVLQINSVSRMPTPAPIVDAQVGLADATILIMLGRDLAGVEIPGLAGR